MDSFDDLCQASNCKNVRFTFCPHCSRHICIKCLNEHYFLMETNFLDDVKKFQRSFSPNRSFFIEDQRAKLNEIYQNELKQCEKYQKLLHQVIGHDGQPRFAQFRPGQYAEFKRDFEILNSQRIRFDHLFDKIQSFIKEYDENRSVKICASLTHSNCVTQDSQSINIKIDSPMIIEIDNDESSPSYDDDTNDVYESSAEFTNESHVISFSTVSADRSKEKEKERKEVLGNHTTHELKRFRCPCPFSKHKFGLQDHHCVENGIGNVPCPRPKTKSSLLHLHLLKYHHFNTLSAFKIIRAVIESKNNFNHIDLFSEASLQSILGSPIIWFMTTCPFHRIKSNETFYSGAFGILPSHQVIFCDERRANSIMVHHHFVTVHQIRHHFASKLVLALMNRDDHHLPVFEPHENILRKK